MVGGMLGARGCVVLGDSGGTGRDEARGDGLTAGRDDADGPSNEAPRDWVGRGDVRMGDGDSLEAEDWAGASSAMHRAGWRAKGYADGGAGWMLCGLAAVGPSNAAAWRRHVDAVDAVVRVFGPGLWAMAAVAILGGVTDVLLPPMPTALPPTAL